MKIKKLFFGILIGQYGLQTLKVSCDLEMIDVIMVEIPWSIPKALFEKLCPGTSLY